MPKSDLQNPAFTDEGKARKALEAIRWPDGPYCPHCGNADQEKIAKGLGKVSRAGLYYCASCNGQFTVTIGTVMEDTKIPLSSYSRCISSAPLRRACAATLPHAWCHLQIGMVSVPSHSRSHDTCRPRRR